MKKILKRLGALGIIIAMIIPFLELPTVKAATNNGCTDHTLQQYLFLDEAMPGATEGGFNTYIDGYATYAIFPNLFEVIGEDQYIRIINVEFDDTMTADDSQSSYSGSLADYYANIAELLNNDSYDSKLNKKIGTYSSGYSDTYDRFTNILHGVWAKEGSASKERYAEWEFWRQSKTSKENYFIKHSLQQVIEKKEKDIELTTRIDGAKYNGQKFTKASSYQKKENFFSAIANRTDTTLIYNNSDVSFNDSEEFIALRIERTITEDDLNKFIYGYVKDGKTYIFTTDKNVESTTKEAINTNIKDGFSSLIADEENQYSIQCTNCSSSGSELDIDVTAQYYWPTVLYVEYEVCSTNGSSDPTDPTNPVTPGKWVLEYVANGGDNDVTNMPSPKSKEYELNASINVSTTEPKRDGYKFNGWCKGETKCTNPLTSKDTVTSDKEATIKLYAQWEKTGTVNNDNTGVISYVIGFISVGLVAGGIYLVAKRKNLFKQI